MKSRNFSASYILCIFVILSFLFMCSPGAGKDIKIDKSIELLTDDGAWCWFADPRAVYYEGKYKRTYIGWVNRSGDICIGYYDHTTGKIKSTILKKGLEYDDHANPALLLLKDGRFIVFYSAHGGKEMYYRTMMIHEDISSWSDEKVLGIERKGKYGYTYPNPVQLSKENNRIYLFFRGSDFKPNFTSSKYGNIWKEARTLIKGSGLRPYVKIASDGIETIHFAFTDGHPHKEENNNIYYAYYKNGYIYRADGSRIKSMQNLPINPSEADKVYDGAASGARGWIWDIANDNSENPVIVYASMPEMNDHRYNYARWDGKQWHNFEISSAGGWFPQTQEGEREREPCYSGGIVLDHTDPSIVYFSRQINGVFEIERWKTHDGGISWEKETVTSDSEKNNVRPVVVRRHRKGDMGIIWMYGDYIHYTNYNTQLKMK
ncbi:BNR-4 repeat-containing protein [candidate division KSB1 bacterium]